jgi:hypothetical protein
MVLSFLWPIINLLHLFYQNLQNLKVESKEKIEVNYNRNLKILWFLNQFESKKERYNSHFSQGVWWTGHAPKSSVARKLKGVYGTPAISWQTFIS